MMTIRKKWVAAAVGAAIFGLTPTAMAGGFAIGTQSGSGTGNAFAGGAAVADDASVVWSNPAGMGYLPTGKHVTGALHVIRPSFKFQNQGSSGAYLAPGTGDGGDGGDWAFVPNGFFAMDINPRLRVGVALNAPFGLKTEYDAGWRGQITALKSEIKTVNINPSVSFKATDTVSIGAGLSVQRIEAELTRFTGAAAAGNAVLEADDTGFGFNFGIMVQAAPSTRLGAAYRSSIKYELEGNAVFTGPGGAALSGGVTADLRVPDSASFSVLHSVNPRWEFMADITWTGWSSVQNLVVVRTTPSALGSAGTTLTTLPFRWDDTWRFGVGANYRLSDRTKLRFGVALDESPTNEQTRTPRLPDEDRTWAAIGVQHRLSKTSVLELGYAHEFIRDAQIRATETGIPGTLSGSFDNKADILSLQYSHSF